MPENKKQIAQYEAKMLREDIQAGRDATNAGDSESEVATRGKEADQYLRDNQDKEHLQDLAKEIFGVCFVATPTTHNTTPTEKNRQSEKEHQASVKQQEAIVNNSEKVIAQIIHQTNG